MRFQASLEVGVSCRRARPTVVVFHNSRNTTACCDACDTRGGDNGGRRSYPMQYRTHTTLPTWTAVCVGVPYSIGSTSKKKNRLEDNGGLTVWGALRNLDREIVLSGVGLHCGIPHQV